MAAATPARPLPLRLMSRSTTGPLALCEAVGELFAAGIVSPANWVVQHLASLPCEAAGIPPLAGASRRRSSATGPALPLVTRSPTTRLDAWQERGLHGHTEAGCFTFYLCPDHAQPVAEGRLCAVSGGEGKGDEPAPITVATSNKQQQQQQQQQTIRAEQLLQAVCLSFSAHTGECLPMAAVELTHLMFAAAEHSHRPSSSVPVPVPVTVIFAGQPATDGVAAFRVVQHGCAVLSGTAHHPSTPGERPQQGQHLRPQTTSFASLGGEWPLAAAAVEDGAYNPALWPGVDSMCTVQSVDSVRVWYGSGGGDSDQTAVAVAGVTMAWQRSPDAAALRLQAAPRTNRSAGVAFRSS